MGTIIRYNTEDIVKLLNYVSNNSTHIPDDISAHKLHGEMLFWQYQHQKTYYIKGEYEVKQPNNTTNKQHLIVKDNNDDIKNKKLLKKLTPHKSLNGKKAFITKCKGLLDDFDNNICNVLSEHIKHKRNSLVMIHKINIIVARHSLKYIILNKLHWYVFILNILYNCTGVHDEILAQSLCTVSCSTR